MDNDYTKFGVDTSPNSTNPASMTVQTGPFVVPRRMMEAMDQEQQLRALALSWVLASRSADKSPYAENVVKDATLYERYLRGGR